jgi:prepilin-type N-terminal cleavage/methylation domain-containing protein
MNVGKCKSKGYSLAELLVVVAIIGTLSLVTVPAFMTYQRGLKLKTSMRQFAADVRQARQRAITEHHPTMISFRTGTTARVYRDFDGTVQSDGTVVYAQRGSDKTLEQTVYFLPSTDSCLFTDGVNSPSSTSGWNDVIFQMNGTVTVPASCQAGKVFIKTDANVGRQRFTFEVSQVGRVIAQ